MKLRWNVVLVVLLLAIGGLAHSVNMTGAWLLAGSAETHAAGSAGLTDATPGQLGGIVLHQNTPNPFTRATTIQFELPRAGRARLTVHDLIGQEVARLVDGDLEAGRHGATLDGRDLPDGVYFYRLTFEGTSRTKICLLLK